MITLVLGLAMMETPRRLARHALLALAVVAQVSGIGCDGSALASCLSSVGVLVSWFCVFVAQTLIANTPVLLLSLAVCLGVWYAMRSVPSERRSDMR